MKQPLAFQTATAKQVHDHWRYTFAGMAITEMFRNNTAYSRDVSAAVKQSVVIADALIAELEKEKGNDN